MAKTVGWGYKNLSDMKNVKKPDNKRDLLKDIISGVKNYPKNFYEKKKLDPNLGKRLGEEAYRRAKSGKNQNEMAENQ